MRETLFYIPDMTAALQYAAAQLCKWGFDITPFPSPNVTHVLLPVPSTSMPIPATLPDDIIVFGGNIGNAPYKTIDLLQDKTYLAQNAAITAHCALTLAMEQLPVTFSECDTLLIGWGRISKCLAPLLRNLGANVTIASRKASERAILEATGFGIVDSTQIDASRYRLIINTAPAPILSESQCRSDTVLMDLASQKGIAGDRVIWARGLPGKHAPESSGNLIAKTVLRYLGKESQ